MIREPLGHTEELGVYPQSEGELWKGLPGGGVGQALDIRFTFQTFLLATCENGGWGLWEGPGAAEEGVPESGGGEEGGEKGVVERENGSGPWPERDGALGPAREGSWKGWYRDRRTAQCPGRPAEGQWPP